RLADAFAHDGRTAQAEDARRRFRDVERNHLNSIERKSVEGTGGPPFIRVDLLRQIAGVAPIFPPAVYAHRFAALNRGSYTEAVALLKKASATDPLIASTVTGSTAIQGAALLREGRLDAAIARLRNAKESELESAESHRLLGMAYWADEQFSAAVEQFG